MCYLAFDAVMSIDNGDRRLRYVDDDDFSITFDSNAIQAI